MVDDSIEDLNLRERASEAFTAQVLLQGNTEFRVNELFLAGGKCNPAVTTITLLIPGEEKRGMRISTDEGKATARLK